MKFVIPMSVFAAAIVFAGATQADEQLRREALALFGRLQPGTYPAVQR